MMSSNIPILTIADYLNIDYSEIECVHCREQDSRYSTASWTVKVKNKPAKIIHLSTLLDHITKQLKK